MNTRLKSERQDEIVRLVRNKGTVSVAELAEHLLVSELTIRRDLTELHGGGHVERVRGGARRPRPQGPEPPVVKRESWNSREKRAIAATALSLVEDGEAIGLEAGSTTLELAVAISRRAWADLTVVTNSFPIGRRLMGLPNLKLIFLSGLVDSDEQATFGVLTEDALRLVRNSRVFIGCRGIGYESGVTCDVDEEREIGTIRRFAEQSDQVVVLADHDKFGREYIIQTLPAEAVHAIVTDDITPSTHLDPFRSAGTRVYVAETGATPEERTP